MSLDTDACVGPEHSLPQRDDLLQPNWIQSLEIRLLVLTAAKPNFESRRD